MSQGQGKGRWTAHHFAGGVVLGAVAGAHEFVGTAVPGHHTAQVGADGVDAVAADGIAALDEQVGGIALETLHQTAVALLVGAQPASGRDAVAELVLGRGAAAAASRDPRRMAEFQRLSGAFGEYLQDLPYQSQIMEFTQEEWNNMGAGRRTEIVNALEAKLRLYEEFNRQPSLWVSFDGGRDAGEAMYPVPIDALP